MRTAPGTGPLRARLHAPIARIAVVVAAVLVLSAVARVLLGADRIRITEPRFGAGTVILSIELGTGFEPGSLRVLLDGSPVNVRVFPGPTGARAELGVTSGTHQVRAGARFGVGEATTWRSDVLSFVTPPPLPLLVAATPADGAEGVLRTAWPRLAFDTVPAPLAIASVDFECGGTSQPVSVHVVAEKTLVINPEGEMPAGAPCVLAWRGGEGPERLVFSTAVAGPPGYVLYNRANLRSTAPFPDDFWLRASEGGTGSPRLDVVMTDFDAPDQILVDALTAYIQGLDGFSPIAHLTFQLSEAADPESIPRTPAESLDPLATIGLFDLTPGSASFAERVPFRAEVRTDTTFGRSAHSLLMFPSVSLAGGGRYGVVITRRAHFGPGRPFEPSLFFRFARDAPAVPGEPYALGRARALSDEVLDAVARHAVPPIPRDDVALAIRFTVRTTDHIPDDLVAIKESVLAAPPPRVAIGQIESFDEGDIVAVVRGSFEAPEFRGADRFLARDPVTGRPVRTATKQIQFVLALPADALIGPVPVVIYQHGNPGSAEVEVVAQARRHLAAEGFAVIGFTDTLNREVSPDGASDEERAYQQVLDLLLSIVARHKVPDYFIQTNAEQLAFLRAIEEIASIERFDTGDPDTVTLAHTFGIDPTQPLLYVGVSEGANHAPALLAVAPEIRAAALVAGGRRFSEVLIHQGEQSFLEPLSILGFRQLGPSDVWVLLSLVQTMFDTQDPHNYAPFIYRRPIEVMGTTRKASILLVEGLDDSLVPNHATEALARALGPLAHLEPVAREVPGLVPTPGPISGNVDSRTTAAFFQFVPEGIAGLPASPGCHSPPLSRRSAREGHRCAQSAEGSLSQRTDFFTSALYDDAPTIDVPLSDTRSP